MPYMRHHTREMGAVHNRIIIRSSSRDSYGLIQRAYLLGTFLNVIGIPMNLKGVSPDLCSRRQEPVTGHHGRCPVTGSGFCRLEPLESLSEEPSIIRVCTVPISKYLAAHHKENVPFKVTLISFLIYMNIISVMMRSKFYLEITFLLY